MSTIALPELVKFLDTELQTATFSDLAINGLQIESLQPWISTVAFAVDSGLSIIEEAVARKADLLVVHHGIFWGKVEPLVGPLGKKAAMCLKDGLSLYASHLPLDGHPVLGNAAQIATTVLEAHEVAADFEHHGSPVGVVASLKNPMTIEQIAQRLSSCDGVTNPPLVLPFGKKSISTVGIVTGSGSSMIPTVARRGIDLLISGEPKQEAYHIARELECSVIFMGHYASETFGVRALQRILEARFGVRTEWISQPTGI